MIEIKSDICELQLYDHVTLLGNEDGISFDSATHKTHLFKMLQGQQRSNKLISNKTIRFIDDPYAFRGLQFNTNDCIIIDEFNYAPNELSDLLLQIRRANAWLIVIGRLWVEQLEYSVDSIISFSIQDSHHVVFSQYFKNNTKFENVPSIIACEDSTSIAAVYSDTLLTEVRPAFSRSNFFRIINKEETAFLIVDKPKFGTDLLRLLYHLKDKNAQTKQLILFCPACFEEIVCEIAKVDLENFAELREQCFDSEKVFEKIAKTVREWDKNNVTKSISSLRESYDFSESLILKDMLAFYNGNNIIDLSRCYVINVDAVSFSAFNDYTLRKNDYLKKKLHSDEGSCKEENKDSPKSMQVL